MPTRLNSTGLKNGFKMAQKANVEPNMVIYVVRRRGRLAPRQPLSVCALLPA